MVKKSDANDVKIRVTKLGAGKVSTGVHVRPPDPGAL
jgi:hypothetical protein